MSNDSDAAREYEAWMLEKSASWSDPIVGHVVDPNLPAVHDPDQANFAAVLDEQALLGLSGELLDLIAKEFHAEGNKLICNRCDMVVTWVTRHCAERHGDDVEVWILPEHMECEQLW